MTLNKKTVTTNLIERFITYTNQDANFSYKEDEDSKDIYLYRKKTGLIPLEKLGSGYGVMVDYSSGEWVFQGRVRPDIQEGQVVYSVFNNKGKGPNLTIFKSKVTHIAGKGNNLPIGLLEGDLLFAIEIEKWKDNKDPFALLRSPTNKEIIDLDKIILSSSSNNRFILGGDKTPKIETNSNSSSSNTSLSKSSIKEGIDKVADRSSKVNENSNKEDIKKEELKEVSTGKESDKSEKDNSSNNSNSKDSKERKSSSKK